MRKGVFLRGVVDSDLQIFFDHQKDPEAVRMAGFPPRDEDAFTSHWQKIRVDPTNVLRTIVCGETSREVVVGNIVSFVVDGERQVGYWVGPLFWGQGVATKALAQFLEEVSERPLFAFAAKQNAASAKVLEKCGFVKRAEQQDADEVAFILV